MAITDDEVRAAEIRMAGRRHRTAAVAAHYDRGRGRVVIRLSTGLEVMFSPHDAQGLESAKPDQLDPIAEISPTGLDCIPEARRGPVCAGPPGRPAGLEELDEAAMERKIATDGRQSRRPRKTAAE